MRKVEYIVVHHVGGWVQRAWDLVRGAFTDVPYDYLVHRDGRVEQGRSLAKRGAHCVATLPTWKTVDFNARSIGVALNGNYHRTEVPPAQFEAAARLVGRLAAEHKIPSTRVLMHRHVTATACPGDRMAARWRAFVDRAWLTKQRTGP